MHFKRRKCDATKDTDEVSDEYVEAAGPIFKAGEVFDKEIGATEHNTDNGEESQLVLSSKAEEMIDNEILAADHRDAKGLVTIIFLLRFTLEPTISTLSSPFSVKSSSALISSSNTSPSSPNHYTSCSLTSSALVAASQ